MNIPVRIYNQIKEKLFGKSPKAYCKWCGRPIFNLDTEFGINKECIYCYEAHQRGERSEYLRGEMKK